MDALSYLGLYAMILALDPDIIIGIISHIVLCDAFYTDTLHMYCLMS